jgi:hypothetical protein
VIGEVLETCGKKKNMEETKAIAINKAAACFNLIFTIVY